MNWEAIGAIGEIVGAIAVVATLVYLARQVTAARTALKRQQSQDVNSMFNDTHNLIASSPSLTTAFAKIEAGRRLDGG